jgi:hypothetical protein
MRQYIGTFVLSASVLVVFPRATVKVFAEADRRPETITLSQLQRRLLETEDSVYAWLVEYESARTLPSGKPCDYFHRLVAAKKPEYYLHWSSHGTSSLDWRKDAFQQRFIMSPLVQVIERPGHRQFRFLTFLPNAPLPGTMPEEFLFYSVGWWPFPQRPSPVWSNNVPCVLAAVARSLDYVLNTQQERVCGKWCHVLHYPNHDRLWLDCDSVAIVAREILDGKRGDLVQRIESSKHREIKRGIWFPFEFRNMHFEVMSLGSEPVKSVDMLLTVLDVRLNEEVHDDVFRFQAMPGSIRTYDDDHSAQYVPGGEDYLDDVIDWSRNTFLIGTMPDSTSGSTKEVLLEYLFLATALIGFLALIFKQRKDVERRIQTFGTSEHQAYTF